MILTVTVNPMLDKTLYLDNFEKGKIYRSRRSDNVAGGKGINVSLQLSVLGIDNIATGFLGGETGNTIKTLMDNEGIKNDFVFIKNQTRIGFTILEESTLIQTSVFEPAPAIDYEKHSALLNKIIGYTSAAEWIVLSGSVGDSNLTNLYSEIINKVREKKQDIKIILDSHGKEFIQAIKERPFIIKPNKNEYENAFNVKINSQDDFISAIKNLYAMGIGLPIITNGEDSVYYSYENKIYKVNPPKINLVNPVGSGDSMMAGIIYGFLNFKSIRDIMAFGIAAGAANAAVWEIAKCKKNYIEGFLDKIKIEEIG